MCITVNLLCMALMYLRNFDLYAAVIQDLVLCLASSVMYCNVHNTRIATQRNVHHNNFPVVMSKICAAIRAVKNAVFVHVTCVFYVHYVTLEAPCGFRGPCVLSL